MPVACRSASLRAQAPRMSRTLLGRKAWARVPHTASGKGGAFRGAGGRRHWRRMAPTICGDGGVGEGGEEGPGEGGEEGLLGGSAVNATLMRKQEEIKRKLEELGERGLDELFSSAQPVSHGRSLFRAMELKMEAGECLVMADVYPSSPATTSPEMGELASRYESWGAGALTVWTDAEVSSNGLEDLQYVISATSVPVIRRDWVIHPCQIVETAGVGASGLTVINTITGQGTPMLYACAAQLGLDAPVEVCNMKDVEAVQSFKIPVYGVNLTVGLALGGLPGFRTNMLHSILGSLPAGSKAVVGVNSAEEAEAARSAGAVCLNVSYAALAATNDPEGLLKSVCKVARQ